MAPIEASPSLSSSSPSFAPANTNSHGNPSNRDHMRFKDHKGESVEIRNVWAGNLDEEDGNFAKGCPCWQFNFKFSLKSDMFAQDSIDLLVKSGISFEDHEIQGIDPVRFGELIMTSGLVLEDRIIWTSFHSGYDYGYLLKLLTSSPLPEDEKEFFNLLYKYFPTIYDIKYMASLIDGFWGGLQKTADDLGAIRIGPEHQAGSDAMLTMSTYFAMAKAKFKDDKTGAINAKRYHNELFGYGDNHTVRRSKGGGDNK
ncbi:hypothetical protein TrRE_jg5988 [Triparma retinervis]|uniref:poly(A)-specific ribonuclease n=1 Tax=Triparma retinervis TaxID=2557542 RepID=A0A9W7KTG8_9STRA|nr:hypothetical protein TrRE_jg5988 [Triparma retinervis]